MKERGWLQDCDCLEYLGRYNGRPHVVLNQADASMALRELRLSRINDVLVFLDSDTQVVDDRDESNFGAIDFLIMTLIRCQGVVGIIYDTICRLAASSAVDCFNIAVETRNTFVKNVASREMAPSNAVSVTKLIFGLQLCISIACNIPLC